MELREALSAISDGHTEWTVDHAQDICKAFGIDFDTNLIDSWTGQADAQRQWPGPKGMFLNEDVPGKGVNSLSLSFHVADHLGIKEYGDFFGRGSQARAISSAVAKHLIRV